MNHITHDLIGHVCNSAVANPNMNLHYGLVRGEVGYVYLCAKLYLVTDKECYYEYSQKFLQSLIQKDSILDDYSLGYGKAGVTWLLSRLKIMDLISERSANDIIDKNRIILKQQCKDMIRNNNFDYFGGALGILYCLYDTGELDDAMVSDFGRGIRDIYSISNPRYSDFSYDDDENVSVTRTGLNIGTPHGITGVILFFLMLKEKGFQNLDDTIDELLEWLLFIYKNKLHESSFPSIIASDGKPNFSSTLSWCYGDLYIIYAFKKAGLLLNNSKYETFASQLLHATVNRTDHQRNNLTICHGINSVSFIYNVLYDLFKTEELYAAKSRWESGSLKILHHLYNGGDINSGSTNDIFTNLSLFNGFPGTFLYFLYLKKEIDVNWNFLLVNY